MFRRRNILLAGLGALTAAALPLAAAQAVTPARTVLAPEDQARLAKAQAYLQGLGAAQGRFTQTDPRGRVTQGAYWLKRPGKIRFEYDKPSGLLIVSDGANVKVQDARLKTFDTYPLSRTPLSVFLAKEIRLDRGARIDRVQAVAGGFSVTARDAKNPNLGAITLTFSDSPVALKEWTVQDAQGGCTRVQLLSLQPSGGFADNLFVLREPRRGLSAP